MAKKIRNIRKSKEAGMHITAMTMTTTTTTFLTISSMTMRNSPTLTLLTRSVSYTTKDLNSKITKNGLSRRHLAILIVKVSSFARRNFAKLNRAPGWLKLLNRLAANINQQMTLSSRRTSRTNSQQKLFRSIELKNVSLMTGRSGRRRS